MATATINGFTTFGSSGSGADSGWGDIGGGPGGAQNTDDFIEGTDSFGGRKTADGRGIIYQAASAVDMTNQHIYCWVNCKSIGALETLANGGLRLRVRTGTTAATNYRTFFIGGSDTVKAGWQLYVIDPSKSGSITDVGTFTLTSVRAIGIELQLASAVGGTSDNILMDIIRYASAPYVTGGTSGDRLTWSDIAAASDASAFGLIQERSGVYFVAGQLALGAPSGAGDCYLDDGGQVLVWEPKEYEDGTSIVTAFATDYNAFIIQEGTGTTDIEDGTLVGTGDDRSGVSGSVFKKSSVGIDGTATSNVLRLEFSGAITAVDMHGTSFVGFDNTVTLSSDATDGPNHVYAGCSFSLCEQVDTGRTVVRNTTFSATAAATADAALLWNANINIKNSSFLSNSRGIEHPSATGSPFAYDGLLFSGNTFDVNNTSGSSIDVNKNNGSNPTTSTGSTVNFLGASVTLLITCIDQATLSDIAGVAVTVKAADGTGSYPYQESVTITSTGGTATVAHTGHGLTTGDKVEIEGANENEYNRIKTITVTGVNEYTYPVSGSPSSPATGTITSTAVFIDDLTDVNGEVSDVRVHSLDQPITGFAAKGTTSPFYKRRPITGTIDDINGATITVSMVSDE